MVTSVGTSARGGPPWWRRKRSLWWLLALLPIVVGLFLLRPYWKLSSTFEDLTFHQPSRLYAQPTILVVGQTFPEEHLITELEGENYREAADAQALPPVGRYRKFTDGLEIHLRTFPTPEGKGGGGMLDVTFKGARIKGLVLNRVEVQRTDLEPPLLAAYYGPDLLERRPVTLSEVSPDLVQAVTAAEDDNFFTHSGVSYTGTLRALWVDLRGGQIRQGGSTLTQQLVKNLYLTQRRTLGRKGEELVLALILELRYSKQDILTAYLNAIYLGRAGGVNVMGAGAAARAFFGKDASQLTLAEAATLAGMIRAPAFYSPLTHPDRSRERRDWVLHRMDQLGHVDKQRIAEALAAPLAPVQDVVVRRRAPYFADAMAVEASKRFQVEDLADSGYALFSTLSWPDQRAAQTAVDNGLAALAKSYEKGRQDEPLQSALVSVSPQTGGMLAYVGGHRYDQSQFDRVSQASRQPGSSFKPIVYATAFENHVATPATFLEDDELEIQFGNQTWTPKNDDGEYHGWVSARTALEHSYNIATARLAMQVGIPKIVALAKQMGITSQLNPFPSVALGAATVSPLEMATVYATLAGGGIRPSLHGLIGVLDGHGKPIAGQELPHPERVLSPQTDFLVTSLLEGVLERGTAAGGASQIRGELAGKTGTTNDRRDNWFAGYSRDRATVVWVGYDSNVSTRLSGARAGLPIWSHFTAAVQPPGGYATFPQPPGIETALIDPTTGLLATEYCPSVLTEVFRAGEKPTELCTAHGSLSAEPGSLTQSSWPPNGQSDEPTQVTPGRPAPHAAEQHAKPHPFRRWLRHLFGKEDDESQRPPDAPKPPDGTEPRPPAGGSDQPPPR
jgi:penicillin-binding protein 1B